jgi:hypothetical protein
VSISHSKSLDFDGLLEFKSDVSTGIRNILISNRSVNRLY